MIEHSDDSNADQVKERPTFFLRCSWHQREFEVSMRVSDRQSLQAVLLPKPHSLWKAMSLGTLIQLLLLIALITIPWLFPEHLSVFRKYVATSMLTPPTTSASKPQPIRPVKPAVNKAEMVSKVISPNLPIRVPVASAPLIKPRTTLSTIETPDLGKDQAAQGPELALASSEMPTLKKPREEVQTGAFGDPDGVPNNGKVKTPNVAQLGSYELPPGPGRGSGTGGAKGTPGVVPSAGFGSGVASGGRAHASGTIRQGLFVDESASKGIPHLKRSAEQESQTKPAQILFKPKPIYSELARSKKIEGEVLLEVTFAASGEVKVVRLVQGLGYGLDEAAESAARQIRFRPAQNEGIPVDSTATVHIVFELAS
jgi:TonB family protein